MYVGSSDSRPTEGYAHSKCHGHERCRDPQTTVHEGPPNSMVLRIVTLSWFGQPENCSSELRGLHRPVSARTPTSVLATSNGLTRAGTLFLFSTSITAERSVGRNGD